MGANQWVNPAFLRLRAVERRILADPEMKEARCAGATRPWSATKRLLAIGCRRPVGGVHRADDVRAGLAGGLGNSRETVTVRMEAVAELSSRSWTTFTDGFRKA